MNTWRLFRGARLGAARSLPALALALALLPGSQVAQAEGTRTLHPASGIGSTGNRGVMDITNTLAGGVARQTQFTYVYAREGEVILLGSRGPVRFFVCEAVWFRCFLQRASVNRSS